MTQEIEIEPVVSIRPSANRVIELIHEYFRPRDKRSIEQMSSDTGIPLQALYDYLDRIEIINSRQTQRPRQIENSYGGSTLALRHVSSARIDAGMVSPLLRRPKFSADHKLIPNLFQALQVAERVNRPVFKELCGQYLNRMSTSASTMPIDSIEQLERFLTVLSPDIPISRWQVIVDIPHRCDADEILNKWRVRPNLDVVSSNHGISGAYQYPDGRARLRLRSAVEKEIVAGKSIVNRFNEQGELVSAKKYSSSLLKYGLFWACVVWLETWELRELVGLPPMVGEQRTLV